MVVVFPTSGGLGVAIGCISIGRGRIFRVVLTKGGKRNRGERLGH